MKIHTKENLYTVIKNDDLLDLTETERQILGLILNKLSQSNPERKYYVVNEDEPYAHKVLETILDGEEAKQPDYRNKIQAELACGFMVAANKGLWGVPQQDGFIEDMVINRIAFEFISYPLLGKLHEEIQPAIDAIIAKMIELKATRWRLGNLERFRDIHSFQDVYTGDILIEQAVIN